MTKIFKEQTSFFINLPANFFSHRANRVSFRNYLQIYLLIKPVVFFSPATDKIDFEFNFQRTFASITQSFNDEKATRKTQTRCSMYWRIFRWEFLWHFSAYNFWSIAKVLNLINTKHAVGSVDNAFFMSQRIFTLSRLMKRFIMSRNLNKSKQKKEQRTNETCMLITKERLQARVGHKRVI